MRIVLSMSDYSQLTGSPLYNYELARELYRQNHEVTILANTIGGEIMQHHNAEAIPVYPFFDHPELTPDLVISSQPTPTSYSLKTFPQAIHMQVIHSLFAYEEPVINKNIKQYIAVRPEIKEHWQKDHPLFKSRVTVIWNGVDTKRFNEEITYKKKNSNEYDFVRLFVGTFDVLRRDVILDLMKDAVKTSTGLWLVMPENPFTGESKPPDNVKFYDPRWDIEVPTRLCDETASIFVGRTSIEGFMCGKPSLIYDVDETGRITKKYGMSVPENRYIFDIKFMTDRIVEVYERVK